MSGFWHVRRSTIWTCTSTDTPRQKNDKFYRCKCTLGLVFRLPPLLYQAAPRPKRCASEWALQRVACPQCGIQTQRRQLRSHQQFTCPASRVAGTAPSARALQQIRNQWRGRGRGRGSLSSSATVAAHRALTASQRGVEVWSTEEFVDILRGGGKQRPERRRGNQCTG